MGNYDAAKFVLNAYCIVMVVFLMEVFSNV